MRLTLDDGGRAAAGYCGKAGDCVCRAIAIGTQLPYQALPDCQRQMCRDLVEAMELVWNVPPRAFGE